MRHYTQFRTQFSCRRTAITAVNAGIYTIVSCEDKEYKYTQLRNNRKNSRSEFKIQTDALKIARINRLMCNPGAITGGPGDMTIVKLLWGVEARWR